jgi:hypothetical protein
MRGDQSLFEGGSVETKFCKWLAAVLESLNTEEQMEFGGQVADLGSHSFRKGISSMLAGLVGVSTISIFLRAGWSLGNVQQRYLFASEGGDQLVGRAADELPRKVSRHVLDHVVVEGATPVNMDDITRLIHSEFVAVRAQWATMQHSSTPTDSTTISEAETPIDWGIWTWGGGIHPVPDDFEFPISNTKDLWEVWFFGNKSLNVKPYKYLLASDMKDIKNKQKLTRAKKVMKTMESTANNCPEYLPPRVKIGSLSSHQSDELFEHVYSKLLSSLHAVRTEFEEERRIGQIAFTTIYNNIIKLSKI